MSEFETSGGYTDIFLQRSPHLPEVKYEWVSEIKYLKVENKKELTKAKKESEEQLQRYIQAYRQTGRPDLKTATVVFIGKNKFELCEASPHLSSC